MHLQVHSPERLTAHQLDDYLEKGWFRMGQNIFTTHFIRNDQKILSTIWLRIQLENFNPDFPLIKKNRKFRISYALAELSPEKEELFARYKQNVAFHGSDSLHQLMIGQHGERSVFNTYEVMLYDNSRLIACGYFDLGALSAEGITSFYDPDYKKFSLGKYLIYLKIMYCKDLGLKYFYPGYFVPGNRHFDYKLSIGNEALQYLDLPSASWMPIQSWTEQTIPIEMMRRKLTRVQQLLLDHNRECRLLHYSFFDANFSVEMRDTGLLDFPLFLSCGSDEEISPVLVFDVRDGKYHLLSCAPVWKLQAPIMVENFYTAYYLMPVAEVHVSESEIEIAGVLSAAE